jgi:threonine/homoserine/homoserine lactone efflux protein
MPGHAYRPLTARQAPVRATHHAAAVTETLASLAAMAFALSLTPGPNNVLLTASGATVGYLRTLPAQAGILLGFVVQIALCALGLGAALTHAPGLRPALAAIATVYMLWLAVRLWRARASASHSDDGRAGRMSWWRYTGLQFVNPKTWLANLAFVTGYLESTRAHSLGTRAALVVAFLVVITTSMTVWTLFGAALRARLGERHWAVVTRTLAVLAAVTVPTVWI